MINIVGTDDRARGAAVIANGVAATFLARERRQQQRQVKSTRNLLNQEISDLQASSTPLNATAIASQIATVRQQLVDLTLATNEGPALELAERAQPPSSPSSPAPGPERGLRALREPLHRRAGRPRPGSAQATGERVAGAEPTARPPGDGRGAVRAPAVRPLAQHAERDRVRGLPDAPGDAPDAACRRTASAPFS